MYSICTGNQSNHKRAKFLNIQLDSLKQQQKIYPAILGHKKRQTSAKPVARKITRVQAVASNCRGGISDPGTAGWANTCFVDRWVRFTTVTTIRELLTSLDLIFGSFLRQISVEVLSFTHSETEQLYLEWCSTVEEWWKKITRQMQKYIYKYLHQLFHWFRVTTKIAGNCHFSCLRILHKINRQEIEFINETILGDFEEFFPH